MTSTGEQRTARERTTIALEQMLADLTDLEAMGLMFARESREAIGAPPAQAKAAIAGVRKPD